MTTPTDGEWMSAQEALDSLGMPFAEAEDTILTHARSGLIRAKAKRCVSPNPIPDNQELYKDFWWAGAGAALKRNWKTGYFEFSRHDLHYEAFGVQFSRSDIEQWKPQSKAATAPAIRTSPARSSAGQTVFIGHGHSEEWRKLAMFLQNDHGLSVIEFNSSSAVGISTTDRLKDMLNQATFAFLILTGEDVRHDPSAASGSALPTEKSYPRLNVVHEAGLFQGRLGFEKAILFLEVGCEEFSNIRGLTHIPFPKGNIDAKFHEATRVLKREELNTQTRSAASEWRCSYGIFDFVDPQLHREAEEDPEKWKEARIDLYNKLVCGVDLVSRGFVQPHNKETYIPAQRWELMRFKEGSHFTEAEGGGVHYIGISVAKR